MGKYMKRSKITANVLPMEVPAAQSSVIGVCTRAKSLALQRLQSSASDDASSYLELRSRRLKKVFSVTQRHHLQVQKPTSPPKQSELINSSARSSPFRTPPTASRQNSVSVGPNKGEASSGNKVAASIERVTRRRSIYSEEANNRSIPSVFLRDMPSLRALEAFLVAAEQEQQRKFMDKYNFDIVAEKPLPGRYEWFRISP